MDVRIYERGECGIVSGRAGRHQAPLCVLTGTRLKSGGDYSIDDCGLLIADFMVDCGSIQHVARWQSGCPEWRAWWPAACGSAVGSNGVCRGGSRAVLPGAWPFDRFL